MICVQRSPFAFDRFTRHRATRKSAEAFARAVIYYGFRRKMLNCVEFIPPGRIAWVRVIET